MSERGLWLADPVSGAYRNENLRNVTANLPFKTNKDLNQHTLISYSNSLKSMTWLKQVTEAEKYVSKNIPPKIPKYVGILFSLRLWLISGLSYINAWLSFKMQYGSVILGDYWGLCLLVLCKMSKRCFYLDRKGAALARGLAAGAWGHLGSGAVVGPWITIGERDGWEKAVGTWFPLLRSSVQAKVLTFGSCAWPHASLIWILVLTWPPGLTSALLHHYSLVWWTRLG